MTGIASILKQEKPFYLIWFVELWERFGFYGMQAILVLYLVKQLGFDDAQAYNTFGAFSALLYAFTSVGGYIGDYVLGTKKTIFLGALILLTGYLMLTVSNEYTIYYGLGAIAVGNGLFKANPSSLLAKLYKADDAKIDGAFTLYYMAINIGSFVSISATPWIAEHYGWNIAFSVSAFGLAFGIMNYLLMLHWAKDLGSKPDFEKLKIPNLILILICTIVASYFSAWLLKNLIAAHYLLGLAGILVVVFFVREIILSKGQIRANLIACLILIIEAIFFFTLYQQMPTSINLYSVRNVTPDLFGFTIEPATFQALNPLWIIIASPVLAYFYNVMGAKGKDFSMPSKFTAGMFCCSLGFFILAVSIYFANSQGMVSSHWLVASYFFQSVGELLVSGLGCAMVARLCPTNLMGFMMGAWFMSTAAAMVLGGWVATIASVPKNLTNPIESLPIYGNLFFYIGTATLVMSLIMVLLIPTLKHLCEKGENQLG